MLPRINLKGFILLLLNDFNLLFNHLSNFDNRLNFGFLLNYWYFNFNWFDNFRLFNLDDGVRLNRYDNWFLFWLDIIGYIFDLFFGLLLLLVLDLLLLFFLCFFALLVLLFY